MLVYIKLKIKKKNTRNEGHKVSSYLLGGGRDGIKRAHIWMSIIGNILFLGL